MERLNSIDEIERLYAARGGLRYGEGVTQWEHAVQCAMLAQAAGSAPSLVVAALLHDIGHLLDGEDELARSGIDDRHETAGAMALSGLFGPDVCAPIALHVSAKRWLCRSEPGYHAALSAASRRSLAVQGGAFDAAQAADFERQPYWEEAVALRRYDDTGKVDGRAVRRFDDFAPLLREQLATRER